MLGTAHDNDIVQMEQEAESESRSLDYGFPFDSIYLGSTEFGKQALSERHKALRFWMRNLRRKYTTMCEYLCM